MTFLLYFCLIFVEALSENVVAFYSFGFKTSPIYFSEKPQNFKKKALVLSELCSKSLKLWGTPPGEP